MVLHLRNQNIRPEAPSGINTELIHLSVTKDKNDFNCFD